MWYNENPKRGRAGFPPPWTCYFFFFFLDFVSWRAVSPKTKISNRSFAISKASFMLSTSYYLLSMILLYYRYIPMSSDMLNFYI